jgi:hypothetical protein
MTLTAKNESRIFSREVTFSMDNTVYAGTIESLSKDGALILTRKPPYPIKNKEILIFISSADKQDIRKAKVAWSDDRAFGAEFV